MFDRERVHLGITPTVWTNDDFPLLGNDIPFEQCVSEMALAGFEGTSVGHKFPRDPEVLKAALDLRGLRVSEPWASTFLTVPGMRQRTVDGFAEQMRFIRALGGDTVVVAEQGGAVHLQPLPLDANKPVLTDSAWEELTTGLDELGKMAAAEGMRLCYHPHMGTVVQTRAEVDRLMAGTDPEHVHLLLDTGHLYWAGDDPLALAREHAARIRHVHLKDVRRAVLDRARAEGLTFQEAVFAGVFTVPGDGVIDFAPILRTLADAGYQGWLVVEAEQDPAKAHPLTYARRARSYLRQVAGL
ncbi:myo-inosose-2 dehydratase [Allostreptomyces psammosilenae]|uniref:Inosose dehydratase n=1 Tax=Allostreptomyces psammosilenae TaxID=1892865 RepID=A0A853A8A9_9ACTN|nr:myo-inosose-2 dehydratase [Allostreptomyces psammosilenae]NYI06881.1 inosose dehydratase [Allostreptomyces psammosilenae]